MAIFFSIFFAIFIFTMTITGIISAVGAADAAQYDIQAAAHLLKTIYVKKFGIPDTAAGPISYVLLAIPGVLAFYLFQTIFGRKQRS